MRPRAAGGAGEARGGEGLDRTGQDVADRSGREEEGVLAFGDGVHGAGHAAEQVQKRGSDGVRDVGGQRVGVAKPNFGAARVAGEYQRLRDEQAGAAVEHRRLEEDDRIVDPQNQGWREAGSQFLAQAAGQVQFGGSAQSVALEGAAGEPDGAVEGLVNRIGEQMWSVHSIREVQSAIHPQPVDGASGRGREAPVSSHRCAFSGSASRQRGPQGIDFTGTALWNGPCISRMRTVMRDRIYITEADADKLRRLIARRRGDRRSEREYLDMLEQELDRAEIVASEAIPRDVVTLNSEVRLLDLTSGDTQRYKLVLPSDFRCDQSVSVLAPIGAAMLGYGSGDTFEVQTPKGTRRMMVLDILFQPEAACVSEP